MSAHLAPVTSGRAATAVRMATAAILAAAATGLLSATTAPVRLVSVSAQGNAVLIEATEPVAYLVSRPDPLTLLVDLRNVSVGDASQAVERGGPVSGVRLEQAAEQDGKAIARVRVALNTPVDHRVRSARNTIRVELSPAAASARARKAAAATPTPQPPAVSRPAPASGAATVLERIRASRTTAGATVVTLSGNGHLASARVSETKDLPRRLVLDFHDISSQAATPIAVDSPSVSRIRVGVNNAAPLVTRVVMEIAQAAAYRVERAGSGGRDVAVVFPQETPIDVERPAGPAARRTTPGQTPPAAGAPQPSPATPVVGPAPDPMSALQLVKAPAETPPPAGAPEPVVKENAAPAPKVAAPTVVVPEASPEPPAASPELNALAVKPAAPRGSAAFAQNPPAPQSEPNPPGTVAPQPPPPTSTAPSGGRQISGQNDKQYTGHPVSFDFPGADLRAVLRTFAELSGLNMVIDPDVNGTVDIILNEVPWDQALEVILRGNGLDYTVDGTIVRIARIATLKKEQDDRQALARAEADAGALSVRTYTLSYAKAATAAPLIKRAVLSQRGDVQIDERTNTLIVTDLEQKLGTVSELLSTLDRPEPQVEIEARIVSTSRDFARTVGVQWGLNGRLSPDIGNTTNLAFPNRGAIGGRNGSQGPAGSDPRAGDLEQNSTVVNLPASPAAGAIGLALGSVNGAFGLDVALSALESSGKVRVLSTPRVTTQNNVRAEMTQGVQIPVQTVQNNTVTVTFKDAALTLKVTPQITAAGTVIMQVELENAEPGEEVIIAEGRIPSINTQRAITTVQVEDGATTIIGGVFISEERSTKDRVPLFHRLPLLGWLFKRDATEDDSRELLIFITPRILKG